MKKFVKILSILIIGLISFMPVNKINAKEEVKVYLFYGEGCGYCARAKEFFNSIEEEYGDKFELVKYEVWSNQTNANLMQDTAKVFGFNAKGVPFIVIGDEYFDGYSEEYNEGIINAIEENYNSEERYDVMDHLGETNSTTTYIVLGTIVVALAALLTFSKLKANK